MQQTLTAAANEAGGEIAGESRIEFEAFDYPACPGAPPQPAWDGWAEIGDGPAPDSADGRSNSATGTASHPVGKSHLNSEERLQEEVRKSFAAGRERGRLEGIEAERAAQAQGGSTEAERHRRQLAEVIGKFAEERDRHLQAIEPAVVKLALAVAARILRREAQMDPLLLTGAVRVALGQLARSSEVRLLVPASDVDLWTETIALMPHLAVRPEVIAGEGMRLGDCVVESKVGTVDLGIRSQLGEIERGFFDRAGSSAPLSSSANAKEHFAAAHGVPAEAIE